MRDDEDAYWVVSVNRATGAAVTVGPLSADEAERHRDLLERQAGVACMTVGRRC